MPKLIYLLANPVMKAMLRSPFHGRMSDRLMVLSFTGRKTGKRYSTPVGYVRNQNEIFVFTHSSWRYNFKDWSPVNMRIQGQEVSGMARLVDEPERIRQMIRAISLANGEEMSRRMGLWVDAIDTVSADEMLRAVRGTYFIEIHPGGST